MDRRTRWLAVALLALSVVLPCAASFWAEYECPSDGATPCQPIRNDPLRVLRRARRAHAIRAANARASRLDRVPTWSGKARAPVPAFAHRSDVDPAKLWLNATCVAPADRPAACQWQVVIAGEYGYDIEHESYGAFDPAAPPGACDVDIFLDPTADLLALAAAGFPEPTVWWNPTEQVVANLPRSSPVLFLAHTTDDDYEELSYDDAFFALRSFRPIPPLDAAPPDAPADARYRRSEGDVFLWGWPEPFPWRDAVADPATAAAGAAAGKGVWVPPRSRVEALYPFRYQPLVLLATCYSRAWSGATNPTDPAATGALAKSLLALSRSFAQTPLPALYPPNPVLTIGVAESHYAVTTEPNGRQRPYPPLLKALRAYADHLSSAPRAAPAPAAAKKVTPPPVAVAGASASEDEYEYEYEEDAATGEGSASSDTTYTVEEFNYDLPSEIEYLRSQVHVYWPGEWSVLQRIGLNATAVGNKPIEILDLGCGPGWFALRLLNAFPSARVTCIDVNPDLLANALSSPAHAPHVASGRLVVRQDSALTLASVADGAFDWVITRFLLQHLPEYPRAVATVHRVLKPGGHFAALESINADVALPHLKLVDRVARTFSQYRDQFHRNGGSVGDGGVHDLTARLVPELRRAPARWSDVQVDGVVTSSQTHSGGIDDFLPLLDPRQFYGLVRANWLTAAELNAARAQWLQALKVRKAEFLMVGYSMMYSATKL